MVLKAEVPGLVHKTDVGAVELDLQTAAEGHAAYRRLIVRFGSRLSSVLVQPIVTGGTEVIIGVTDDHMPGTIRSMRARVTPTPPSSIGCCYTIEE